MGVYNFKPQFVPAIMADKKRHTIRAKRKYPDKPGSICHLYVGLRKKGARILKRRRCVRVQSIAIMERHGRPADVWIDGLAISRDEKERLARNDGFESFPLMMCFWNGRLPFEGDLIHWESDEEAARRAQLEKDEHLRAIWPGCGII